MDQQGRTEARKTAFEVMDEHVLVDQVPGRILPGEIQGEEVARHFVVDKRGPRMNLTHAHRGIFAKQLDSRGVLLGYQCHLHPTERESGVGERDVLVGKGARREQRGEGIWGLWKPSL